MAISTPNSWNIHPLHEVVSCPECGLPMEAELFSHPVPCAACVAPDVLGLDDELDAMLAPLVMRTTKLRVAVQNEEY